MLNKTIDKSKRAKPRGWRFKGSHAKLGSRYYKQPSRVLSSDEFERAKNRGLVTYEPRLGKADANQANRFSLGGFIDMDFLTTKVSFAELFTTI